MFRIFLSPSSVDFTGDIVLFNSSSILFFIFIDLSMIVERNDGTAILLDEVYVNSSSVPLL